MSFAVCNSCLKPIVPPSCTSPVDRRCVCQCPQPSAILSVGFITINGTVWNATVCNKPEEPRDEELASWNKSLKAMRDWKATLSGHIEERTPVPSAFQNEFKDDELEP